MFKIVSIFIFGCISFVIVVTFFGSAPTKDNAFLSNLSQKNLSSADDCQISYTYLGKTKSSNEWAEIAFRGKHSLLKDVSLSCGENDLFFKTISVFPQKAVGKKIEAWHQFDQVEQISERLNIVNFNRSHRLAPYFSSFICDDDPILSRQHYHCSIDQSAVLFMIRPHGQNEQICSEFASIFVEGEKFLLFGPWKDCGLLTSSDNHLFLKKIALINRILK